MTSPALGPPRRDVTASAPNRHREWPSVAEAIADPATPDTRLMRLASTGNVEHLGALVRRRPMSPELSRWLVNWCLTAGQQPSDGINRLFAAAAALPHITDGNLRRLADRLPTHGDGHGDAVIAIATHPRATAETVCAALWADPIDSPASQAVGRSGSLVPAARRFAMTEGLTTSTRPADLTTATLGVLTELRRVLPDAASRQVVAALGPTWLHTRAELIQVARTIARGDAAA